MKQTLQLSLISILLLGIGLTQSWSQATTFSFTGAVQTYTVPLGVTSIQIETWGAQGGSATGLDGVPATGGLGGYAIGNLEVTPGQILEVYVGGEGDDSGPGGYNGGGQAGTNYGCAGGGASDVRTGAYTLSDRVIVGGGGGGGAFGSYGNPGGHGGGLIGEMGSSGGGFTAGSGGTQVAGGAAGCCYGAASAGTFGLGAGPGDYHNAGGGGGWYGGGSGAGQAGAGGGSSYIDGVTDGETTTGLRTGDGEIIITVLCTPLELAEVDVELCLGDEIILDATSELDGSITWDGDVIDGEAFAPPVGTTTYTASSDADGDCGFSIDITVLELPEVTASTTEEEICIGGAITLTGGGADAYAWDMDVTDGEEFTPEAGEYTYTVTGTDTETGCENTAEVEVSVYELPEVVATATDEEICLGESLTLNGEGATTYVWDAEEDGVEFTPAETGTTTYTVEGTDDNGCVNEASIDVTVYEALEITYTTTDEIMGSDGEINITVTGGNPAYTFDWDNDGTGDFDDDEDLTGLTGGTYTVEVMCEAGCSVSETITLGSQVGIDELNSLNVAVYPNPTTGLVTIKFEGTFTYELTDINGAVIAQATATDKEMISLENVARGVYFVTIKSNDAIHTVKVVKK